MQRRRRQPVREQKPIIGALDGIQELSSLLEFRLTYLQLKADLDLMKIDQQLSKQIQILQQRRLKQLNNI